MVRSSLAVRIFGFSIAPLAYPIDGYRAPPSRATARDLVYKELGIDQPTTRGGALRNRKTAGRLADLRSLPAERPRRCILEMSVVLDSPSLAAAPSQPPRTQFVACKVATMWSRSTCASVRDEAAARLVWRSRSGSRNVGPVVATTARWMTMFPESVSRELKRQIKAQRREARKRAEKTRRQLAEHCAQWMHDVEDAWLAKS